MGAYDYSTTANSNSSVGGVSLAEGMNPSAVNNAIRAVMADTKALLNDIAAQNVSSGTDTITLTSDSTIAAYADGMRFTFIAGGTNTGPATLNIDSVGAKAVRKGADVALAAGDIAAGMAVDVVYDASANAAAGAWLMIGAGFQPSDADLTSWAAVTRASGFDTFVATPSSANLKSLVTDETGSGALVFATSPAIATPTLTDPIITGAILEDIYTITDGAAFEIDPSNGTLQRVVLGADRTPLATNFANGESVTLMVDDGTARTITWTGVSVVWVGGSAPTLATSGFTIIELWKEGNVIRGALVGSTAS